MNRRLSTEVDAAIVDVNELKESLEGVGQDMYDVLLVNGFLSPNETTIQSWGFHPCNEW